MELSVKRTKAEQNKTWQQWLKAKEQIPVVYRSNAMKGPGLKLHLHVWSVAVQWLPSLYFSTVALYFIYKKPDLLHLLQIECLLFNFSGSICLCIWLLYWSWKTVMRALAFLQCGWGLMSALLLFLILCSVAFFSGLIKNAFFQQECSRILERLRLEDSKCISYYNADRLGCVVTTPELKSS